MNSQDIDLIIARASRDGESTSQQMRHERLNSELDTVTNTIEKQLDIILTEYTKGEKIPENSFSPTKSAIQNIAIAIGYLKGFARG